jgi:hypothetical protein
LLYDKIKEIAKEKSIPIYKIEEDCGFAQGSICKWNEISPSWEKIQKVASYLKVSTDCLTTIDCLKI